ncbi:MAG: hypothetical protein J7539_17885, partial [Niabella sp.]|nr:hypothetical protein [Niabella sp.]
TIECLKEFSNNQTIVINAIKKNAQGIEELNPAGKLIVWANDQTKRKKKKALLVDVKTAVGGVGPAQGNSSGQSTLFNQYLKQALIETEIDTMILDVSSDPNFQPGGYYENSGQIAAFYEDATKAPKGFVSMEQYLHKKLKQQLKSVNPKNENKYDSVFKAFYIGEHGGCLDTFGNIKALGGYSSPTGTKDVVLFPGKTDQTAAHEFLHSFGLPHSFTNKEAVNGNNAFCTFEYAKTENLMDYSHLKGNPRYNIWHWQWKVANNSVK